MSVKKLEAQNPLILRSHRLMEAFAKSDDERDFYLDRLEGFIVYVDLDKPQNELEALEEELLTNKDRYCLIPKLTFYETKKIMEGFVNEKVYDIDTKEKLLDIIQSKEARENFLEFIYDHHSELEKWQQFYQERSRIRIIEWLRINHFHFVFEEDLDLNRGIIEKLKRHLLEAKVGKDILSARKILVAKAKTYYSNEALNPRPKRGRPPKQAVKQEIEPQITTDIYTTVPAPIRPFLFIPDYTSGSSVTFSSKFETEEQLLASRRHHLHPEADLSTINQKLAALRTLSTKWVDPDKNTATSSFDDDDSDDDLDEDFDDNLDEDESGLNGARSSKVAGKAKVASKQKASSSKAKPTKRVPKTPKPAAKKKVAPPAKKKQPAKVKLITNEKGKGKPKAKLTIKGKKK